MLLGVTTHSLFVILIDLWIEQCVPHTCNSSTPVMNHDFTACSTCIRISHHSVILGMMHKNSSCFVSMCLLRMKYERFFKQYEVLLRLLPSDGTGKENISNTLIKDSTSKTMSSSRSSKAVLSEHNGQSEVISCETSAYNKKLITDSGWYNITLL